MASLDAINRPTPTPDHDTTVVVTTRIHAEFRRRFRRNQCRRTFVTVYRPISDENQKFEVVGIPSAISDGIPTKHGSSEFSDDFSTTFP
ncbi:hypothetical protein YC2023_074951 [Brassica napus]